MDGNIIELVKLGHELAKELHCAESAALVRELASQLEVQFARSNALAAKLSMINGLMDAAEQANKLAQGATEKLVQERDALAAENAGLKAAFDKPQAYLSWHAIPPTWEDPLPCGEYLDVHDEAGHKNSDGTDCWPVFAKPEIETPATSAFLAEVRAQGVDAAIEHLHKKFEGTGQIGVPVMALEWLAQELRKGGAE
ncbi:hypothetical protein [Citrobacter koseri]|uniref:hypothetical protein n=1 Tax=Citrobacter koseri TaxID=545 RepID=UPI0006920A38|nr:hypothetical protein [Citrobacter koseri]